MNYPDRDPALNVRLVTDPVNTREAGQSIADQAAAYLAQTLADEAKKDGGSHA